MSTFDVVVVGAGASGCSIAAHLLRERPGLRVALVDRAHIGAGSTSRSTAAFRHQWSTPAHVAFSKYAAAEFGRLAERGVPVSFRSNGYLFLFTEEPAFEAARERADSQRGLGVSHVEVLRPGELVGRVDVAPWIDRDALVGAVWGPDDGFLDPLALAQGYLDEACVNGARYVCGRRVERVDVVGGRVRGVVLDRADRLHAAVVVVAAGVWGSGLMSRSGFVLPMRPAKRHLYHSKPVRGLDVSSWPLVIGDRGQHTRPSEGNALMFAWEHRPDPLPRSPGDDALWSGQDEIDTGFGTAPGEYGFDVLSEMARHVPVLAEATALHRVTCGWYAVTLDHKAILAEDPRCAGLFHATGFSGHGIMHAPATGLVIASLVLDREVPGIPREQIRREFELSPLLDGQPREPVESMVL